MFVLGGAMWMPNLLGGNGVVTILATMALTIVNSLLLAQVFYRSRETNVPSLVVAATYWVCMSSLPMLHGCWQTQLMAFGVLLALIIVLGIDYQQEATEDIFLASLICCFLLPIRIAKIIGIIAIWGYLIFKGYMTWRVWAASLIAISIRVLLMLILYYFGWCSWCWQENIPSLTWQEWSIFSGIFVGMIIATILPIRRPSIISGIIYLLCTLGLLTSSIVMYLEGF